MLKKAALRAQEETVESLDSRLDELGRKMDRLRSLYESFFMGSDRAPPNVPRRELNRLILEMQQTPIRNATLRFRFQSLQQRWVLFTTYWNRTLQEIEAGTYRRDLLRAQRHLATRGGSITEQEALALGIPANRVRAFVGRQIKRVEGRKPAEARSESSAPPAEPPAQPVPAPTEAGGARLSEEQLQTFYRKFVEVHQQAAGAPPKATAEQLRGKLEKLLGGQSFEKVELDVAVEGGKVKVRARPVQKKG